MKCSVCKIILSNKEPFNSQSSNPERCIDCEFVEEKIKNKCDLCGATYENTLHLYTLFGNTCGKCMRKINNKMHYKDCLIKIPHYQILKSKTILNIKQEALLKECINFVKYYERKLSTVDL